MTSLDKKYILNTLFRLGYHYYAYCNGTIRFFKSLTEAEFHVRNMKFLSIRMDQNFSEDSFYAKEFSDLHCEEIINKKIRMEIE